MHYTPTSAEKAHIKKDGDRFATALAFATLAVRQDGRLTGLDRIREPLAFKAALRATGYEQARYVPPPVKPGGLPTDINEIAQLVFDRAVEAARDRLRGDASK